MQKHPTLMDSIALLCVVQAFEDTYGINSISPLNSPAPKATTDVVGAMQFCLNGLHATARSEISRLVSGHRREKAVTRYK